MEEIKISERKALTSLKIELNNKANVTISIEAGIITDVESYGYLLDSLSSVEEIITMEEDDFEELGEFLKELRKIYRNKILNE